MQRTDPAVDDMVLYRCGSCTRQFFSTEADPECPCGHRATVSECQDTFRTEATLRDELLSLRRTIYMLVEQAGGRVELDFFALERVGAGDATLECYYDHIRNRQVLTVRRVDPKRLCKITHDTIKG